MLIVVALGGNAVSLPNQEGNISEQFAATRKVMRPLADLLVQGHQLIITHGNGPQVGNVMRRVEIAAEQHVYPLPLDIVVADTEAGMGYMVCQCLMNELTARGQSRVCATLVTTVCVDPSDPEMSNPHKPVGPFLSKDQAQRHMQRDGWKMVEQPPHGWRRLVPSPVPLEIIELPLLKTLVAAGHLIVAAGGGGIAISRDEHGCFRGVEAVIDKDRTSAILAAELGADRLVILTNVDQVQRDFGKPGATAIHQMNVEEAMALLEQGQFPPGSMAPKIEAAVDFIRRSRRAEVEVLITSCERAGEALAGQTGTRIHGALIHA
jgi:carbamate kinase